jgi:hypothetical protein
MELELEGNLILERPPTRRWVSIVAVVVPVVACVVLAAWFIRAYIAPPMAQIPSPMQLAAMSRAPVKVEVPASAPAPELPPPQAASEPEPAAPPADAPVSLPMFATLSVAPPSFNSAPGYADATPDPPAAAFAPPAADQQVAAVDPAMTVAGPVPLPRSKPPVSVAAVAGPVPLPRPRPAEAAPAETPAVPAFDRTAIQ